jgi:hypothetical protein
MWDFVGWCTALEFNPQTKGAGNRSVGRFASRLDPFCACGALANFAREMRPDLLKLVVEAFAGFVQSASDWLGISLYGPGWRAAIDGGYFAISKFKFWRWRRDRRIAVIIRFTNCVYIWFTNW